MARKLGENLRRDSASQKDAADGHGLKRQIARFRAVNRYPQIQRLFGQRICAVQGGMGNRRCAVSLRKLGGKSGRLVSTSLFAKKLVHVDQAWPGEHAFVADMSVTARQKPQQFDLQIALGCEIRVSALAGKHLMLAAVPEQPGFSQAGSGRDHRLIAIRRHHLVKRDQILRAEGPNSPRIGFEIIDQQSGGQLNLFRQTGLVDDPGKVRSFDASIVDRSCDAETSSLGPRRRVGEELRNNLTQFAVFAAGKNALGNQPKMAVLGLKIGESSVGAANIAGQYHFSKFLQRRPSRSNSSSASFGPHVPEA